MDQEQDQVAPVEVNGADEQHHGGGSIDIGAGSDGPPSLIGVGPPSPLTGCYLLIIIGEPHSQDHKDIILQRLIKAISDVACAPCGDEKPFLEVLASEIPAFDVVFAMQTDS
uniref:Uncharacterized protein n=1 Tax=Anopheles farauti TaxID=69004 RepID=A0A182QUP5_9DIPT